MTESDNNPMQGNQNNVINDEILIELIHAFRDIFIAYFNKKGGAK